MTYQETLAYIHSVNWCFCKPGLSRVTALCHALGDPQAKLRFIHVAGTNGKGSTCAMLASVLQAAGYRVGLFTSPFILRFNERMQVDGVPISDQELIDITAQVKPLADRMPAEDRPTEFELITAVALLWFLHRQCDVVVFEVGMGGRLDATNLLEADQVLASVITGIAMDHTAYLGDTPEKIAAEKAGIIKSGVPVIFGGTHTPVGQSHPEGAVVVDPVSCGNVIRQQAERMGAPYIPVDIRRLSHVRSDLYGCDFHFGALTNLHIPLAGLYQPYNAATALTVLEVLRTRGLMLSEEAIRMGLASVSWPGRFEILCRDPLVISDGGHNPEGIDAAVASIQAYFGHARINLLTGVMADKDYTHMVERLKDIAARVFAVCPNDGHGRALQASRFADVFVQAGIPAHGYETVATALHAAMEDARATQTPLLCIGSLYMYGELRDALQK